MRVVITGMGGALGAGVARRLEEHADVSAILGLDIDPPRRPLQQARFHRIDPRNRIRTADVVRRFAPTALLHLGTYEPDARSDPKAAIERTAAGSIAALGAAADAGALERIIVRSGVEVYGRRKGASPLPDEEVRPDPTTPWGHSLRHAEMIAIETGDSLDIPVTALRLAPIVGPHHPGPLGRVLRERVIPFAAFGDPPFSLLHPDDAIDAIVAALDRSVGGPLNIVGDGSVSMTRAALMGRRVPVPVCGVGWRATRSVARLTGAPTPRHVFELMTRGRLADGSRSAEVLHWTPSRTTREVVADLYRVTDAMLDEHVVAAA